MSRLLILGCLLCLVGCGSIGDNGVSVRGKVDYCGQPLAGGTIVFTPDEARGHHGPLGYAIIQPDGSYTLRVADGNLEPGWHRVTIAPPPDTGSRFPPHYRHPQMSGLHREVKASDNIIDFQLEATEMVTNFKIP